MKERTTRSAPCIFCGDVGYDMRVYYNENGEEEIVHYCHKTNAQKGDIVSAGTENYICVAAGKELPVVGAFDLWKKYLTKEEWMTKQERTNPDWKKSNHSGAKRSNGSAIQYRQVNISAPRDKDALVSGEVRTRSPREQHAFNTYLASLLVLEPKHEAAFRKEWESSAFPEIADFILQRYPIRSFPPIDKARFANGETFKNPTRKQLVEKLVAKFGDLRGYPFMYLRTGAYWDSKPESERWTFACGEGVIFPCIEKDSFFWRYRIKNEYPDIKIKEGVHPSFNGKWGRFHHYYDKDGKHCWSFKENDTDVWVPVYGPGSDNSLTLNKKGMPSMGGKPEGKYANISSVLEKRLADGTVVNAFMEGCRSGSPYSLYYQKEDSFAVVIGTEGEKKSMVANRIKKLPVVCVPGVTSFSVVFEKGEDGRSLIDFLKEKGMKYFILCYDADKTENDRVLAAETAFIEELKKHGVVPLIGEWKGKFQKGIDDILLMGLDISVRRV